MYFFHLESRVGWSLSPPCGSLLNQNKRASSTINGDYEADFPVLFLKNRSKQCRQFSVICLLQLKFVIVTALYQGPVKEY